MNCAYLLLNIISIFAHVNSFVLSAVFTEEICNICLFNKKL